MVSGTSQPWAKIRVSTEVRTLFPYRQKSIVLLALVALLVAQAAAGLHALKHFGKQGDPLGLPGHHVQLCLECASFAPLDTTHGAGPAALIVAALNPRAIINSIVQAPAPRAPHIRFRSRAPPPR